MQAGSCTKKCQLLTGAAAQRNASFLLGCQAMTVPTAAAVWDTEEDLPHKSHIKSVVYCPIEIGPCYPTFFNTFGQVRAWQSTAEQPQPSRR